MSVPLPERSTSTNVNECMGKFSDVEVVPDFYDSHLKQQVEAKQVIWFGLGHIIFRMTIFFSVFWKNIKKKAMEGFFFWHVPTLHVTGTTYRTVYQPCTLHATNRRLYPLSSRS